MDSWMEVALLEALTGKGHSVAIDGQKVLLLRAADQVFAIGNQCTHQGAAFGKGVVRIAGSVRTVTCPAHGSIFNLQDGQGDAATGHEAGSCL
jgi:nitrite reductase/ring-hydroxylating ferredoxin subunit